MLVVSPHLDDAVLGCGQLLAAHPGSTVLTVFAGVPREAQRRTEWDARCGFASAQEAVSSRRLEDRDALAGLGAEPVWFDFCDSQYEQSPSVHEVAHALAELIRDRAPDLVLYPIGLYHSDHFLVHEAAREALSTWPDIRALAYEDALYRGLRGLLQQRLMALATEGVCATPARLDSEADRGSAERKAHALQAYTSQLRGLGPKGYEDARQPERFWTLETQELTHGA